MPDFSIGQVVKIEGTIVGLCQYEDGEDQVLLRVIDPLHNARDNWVPVSVLVDPDA